MIEATAHISRFSKFAPIYRSLPLDVCVEVARAHTVLVVGQPIEALSKHLGAIAKRVLSFRPLQTATEMTKQMLSYFRSVEPIDVVIFLEPDVAATLLGDVELGFEIRQKTRRMLIVPMVGASPAVTAIWGPGVSAHESADGLDWRWIVAEDSSVTLALAVGGSAAVPVSFSFVTWFSENAPRPSRIVVEGTNQATTVQVASIGSTVSAKLMLSNSISQVKISSDIPSQSDGCDPRALSLGVVNPTIVGADGIMIVDPRYICRGTTPWWIDYRLALHRLGYYCVSTVLAGDNFASRGIWHTSLGSPAHGFHDFDLMATLSKEVSIQSREVMWFFAGDGLPGGAS